MLGIPLELAETMRGVRGGHCAEGRSGERDGRPLRGVGPSVINTEKTHLFEERKRRREMLPESHFLSGSVIFLSGSCGS